jgi:PHD/YefM family antitoxin component YafN of YafNO toxin-antitoxin module
MQIELTEEQKQAVKNGKPVRVTVAELDSDLVLLRAQEYEDIREFLEDEREKAAWAKLARKAANRWATENPY